VDQKPKEEPLPLGKTQKRRNFGVLFGKRLLELRGKTNSETKGVILAFLDLLVQVKHL